MTGGPVAFEELRSRLEARIQSLCEHLYPNGHKDGRYWRSGDVYDTPPTKGGSFYVNLMGSYQGWWKDEADPQHGKLKDALDLIAWRKFDGDVKRAIPWAKDFVGLGSGPIPQETAEDRRRREEARQQRAREDARKRDEKRRRAQAIWIGARKELIDTPVDGYLQSRGVDLRSIHDKTGLTVNSIRFAPACFNSELGAKLPAMVAPIVGKPAPRNEGGGFLAIHRTYLKVHADGTVTKYPGLENPKKTYGEFAHRDDLSEEGEYIGGAIRLWRGLVADDEGELKYGPVFHRLDQGNHELGVSEGIEDGLHAVQARPVLRVHAAVFQRNIGSMWLAAGVKRIRYISQNEDNPQAEAGFWSQVQQLQLRGRTVLDARPPADVKDITEMAEDE